MYYIFRAMTPRLLQRIRAFGAVSVTFFAFLGAPAVAEPTLNLISPVAGIDMTSTPAQPEDVLSKLRRGFELTYEDNNRTAAELKWFAKHPDYLNRVFTRSQRYLPYIVGELERRDMPLELALLPIVESAYDPFAYSHGRAAGLWQMIPGTATRFRNQTELVVRRSSRRCRFDACGPRLPRTSSLHELNDGNWLNAIASYNSGEGNVLRAARKNRKANKPDRFLVA